MQKINKILKTCFSTFITKLYKITKCNQLKNYKNLLKIRIQDIYFIIIILYFNFNFLCHKLG